MPSLQNIRPQLLSNTEHLFSSCKMAAPLIGVGVVMGFLITWNKWYYLMGFVFAALYIVFALRHRWEILLVMIFFVDLIWGYVMRRGSYILSSFIIDHSLLLLFATLLYYFAWKRLKTHKNIGIKNSTSKEYMLIVIFTVLLFVGGLTWLEFRDTPPYEWWRFGIAGLGAFILGAEVGKDFKRTKQFVLLLFSLLFLISLEISIRQWLNFELIEVQHGLDYYVEQRFGIHSQRYTALFSGIEGDAFLMVIALSLGVGIILNNSSKLLKIACAIALIPVVKIIVSSLDRTAWSTGILILLSWCFYSFRFSNRQIVRLIIVILTVIICLSLLLIPEIIKGDLSDFFYDFFRSDRYKLWYSTIKALPDFPVLGIGYHNGEKFSFTLSQANPSVTYILPLYGHYGQYDDPHNSYLEIMTFAGVPTFIVFMLFLVRVFYIGHKVLHLEQVQNTRLTILTIYIALFALCVFSFFKKHLWLWPVNLLFWMLSGIVVGFKSHPQKDIN